MTAYDNFIDLVGRRYSCRAFTDQPVDRADITKILEAARLAPSACNRQPWHFIVVDTPEECRRITECYHRPWAQDARAFIIAVGEHSQAWHRPEDNKDHTDVDLSIAIEHICLAAASLGIGSCWICNFDPDKLPAALGLSEGLEAIAVVALGHPATSDVPEKKRKPLEEIVKWGL